MKLLLTSNGFINTPLEKDFLEMADGKTNLKVAIIPTAGDPIEWVPEKEGDQTKDYVAKLTRPNDVEYGKGQEYIYLKSKGYDVVIVDLKDDPIEIRKELESVDIIIVGGGDVNWLLDWSKKSKLDSYLKDILDRGVVYVGTSAGSGLLNPDIGLTWWEPDWKLDHIGLGIVDFIIVPHQKESELELNLKKYEERRAHLQSLINFPWKVYLLQDGQAVKVMDEKVEHIGSGAKRFI